MIMKRRTSSDETGSSGKNLKLEGLQSSVM